MNSHEIHIIGGGIIGLCSAWYLAKEGFRITIIDDNDFTDGASFGNAGMIVPSHFIPMAAPGVISQGLKWILDSRSPFYVKPRLNIELLQWLWNFHRAANQEHVEKSMPMLYEFNERSKELYREIAEEDGFDFDFEERGLLMLYKTLKQAEKEEKLANQAHQLGIEAQILNPDELISLEPEMDFDVLGGVYFPGDAHLYPNHLIEQMIAKLIQSGVQVLSNTKIADFITGRTVIEALVEDNGARIPVENVLLSTGSWTAMLLKKVGIHILLQDGKGYSTTLSNPEHRPRIPTILTEAKVALTPMGNDLRIGGTLELSGLSTKISKKRVEGILQSVPQYYKNLKVPFPAKENIWKGFRPCSPDGMPYIGKSNILSNLTVATGHGMMGLSLGAATGKLISQILTDQTPLLDPHSFRLNRM